jgi:hypothetical protein
VKWSFEVNDGRVHDLLILDTHYSSSVPGQILSLLHWAQSANDNFPTVCGMYSVMYDDCVEMYWNQKKFKQTAPYDPVTNVAMIHICPELHTIQCLLLGGQQ